MRFVNLFINLVPFFVNAVAISYLIRGLIGIISAINYIYEVLCPYVFRSFKPQRALLCFDAG